MFVSGAELIVNSLFGTWLSKNWLKLCRSDIKASLQNYLPFWQGMTSDPYIVKVIGSGYQLDFTSWPPRFEEDNNTTAVENYDFVLQSVAELFINGFAELTDTKPPVVNPSSVSIQSNGKKRLIADLRHLNKYLKMPHVRYSR